MPVKAIKILPEKDTNILPVKATKISTAVRGEGEGGSTYFGRCFSSPTVASNIELR